METWMKAQRSLPWMLGVVLACAPMNALGAQQAPAEGGAAAGTAAPVTPNPPSAASIIVPTGTKLPMVLHNAITTRNAKPGDPVYLETTFPIAQEGKIVVPAGSYVQGEVIAAQRPGKVKGQGEINIRLTMMILPNGYTVRFDGVPSNAGTGGNEITNAEGAVIGDTDRGTDVGTVVKTTGAGAGIGGLAGRSGTAAGIGAAAGAAAGLAAVLLTRGPDVELPRGTTLEAVLDRPLTLDASKVTFTDPGRASSMGGAPNRQPVRNSRPF
jgi:type IV secretion system protein VirB10